MHQGDVPAPRRELLYAPHLRPLLTSALPHLTVQARLELVRVHLALTDPAGARTVMREVDDLLRRWPGLGTLVGEAGHSGSVLQGPRFEHRSVSADRPLPSCTCSRCCPPTCRSRRSPGEMFLSRHTIESEAMSIYRKLGASSRSQAVTRSRELGLLEG